VDNDITVSIAAAGEQVISRVATSHDGFDPADDELDPPCDSDERQFLQVRDAVRARELTVTVTDVHGKQATSDRRWLDIT